MTTMIPTTAATSDPYQQWLEAASTLPKADMATMLSTALPVLSGVVVLAAVFLR